MRELHQEEIDERKVAFQRLWRERWLDEVVSALPANQHDRVHQLLKAAFKAGTTWERRKHEPQQLGGID